MDVEDNEREDPPGENVLIEEGGLPDQLEGDNDMDVSSIDQNAEQSQLVHRFTAERSKSKDSDVETEFACSVCLQLSALPTTLICGHTSCRYCLAQWYFTSKKKECPLCKAPYQGHPKVNTQLRNMLTRLYPDDMKEREEEAKSKEIKSTIDLYDKELSKETTSTSSSRSDMTSFCSGIIVASCIFVVSYLAWYWKSHDDNLLVKKPVIIWSPDNVETWLNEISWAGQYAHLAQEKHIDGRLLLSVREDDLIRLFNISETSHAKALMLLISDLHDSGVKMPANLWEYKALYPGRCLFLVFGLKDFPRTTILYLYMYFREEMFYPFVVATQEDEDSILSELHSSNNSVSEFYNSGGIIRPSSGGLIGFIYCAVTMPEYLIGVVAYSMSRHHFFTPIFIMATLSCRIVLEFLKIKHFIRNRSWSLVFEMGKQHMKHLMSAFMFMILWPVIPTLVCDVFFYCALYVSPIQMLSTVYTQLRHPQPDQVF